MFSFCRIFYIRVSKYILLKLQKVRVETQPGELKAILIWLGKDKLVYETLLLMYITSCGCLAGVVLLIVP